MKRKLLRKLAACGVRERCGKIKDVFKV